MSIDLQVKPGQRYIELGGGARPLVRPNVDTRICHDADGNQTVDFTADFNEPLPIQSSEFDGVFSNFCLEHISYRNTLSFLKEVHRILKPGGKFVCVTSNTQAQIEWARNNPNGWDGRDFFESVSGLLFGDLDYPENSHKAYFSPPILESLFHKAGFTNVKIQAYGARDTDLCVEGSRPRALVTPTHTDPALQRQGEATKVDAAKSAVVDSREELRKQMEAALITQPTTEPAPAVETQPPAVLFDKFYFNGGAKVGGYAREGYRDFHCHEITARKVLLRRPSSVLEIGAARGYVGKRLEDAGVRYLGLEVSKHCYMTRVVDPIKTWDILQTPWSLGQTLTEPFDLSFSIAVLEHVPEDRLPAVLRELGRLCKSHLHGIDFGGKDDGFDRTHRTLRPLDWWKTQFSNAGLTNYEIVDKEDMERGDFPRDVMEGDGKVKVNVGSFTTMFHHGWVNMDCIDLTQFAQPNGYKFLHHDARNGLPFNTGGVDLIMCCHMLEHLSYKEGLTFLRECRRVLKPTGAIRIIVPDLALLVASYSGNTFGRDDTGQPVTVPDITEFDELNLDAGNFPTDGSKLWNLLCSGHQAGYDHETLGALMEQAGLHWHAAAFRKTAVEQSKQILRETLDVLPCLSLYVDGLPNHVG